MFSSKIYDVAQKSLSYLVNKSKELDLLQLSHNVLRDERFPIWSGSGRPFQHHYGNSGLVIHTAEVVNLCFLNIRAALLSLVQIQQDRLQKYVFCLMPILKQEAR